MPGRMRFQWWKDSLADIFAGDPPPQPVALALADIIKKEPGLLTRRWFDRVLDARMVDLEQAQPETLVEMETYAENTASSLLYLSLEVAGIRVGSGPGTATLGHAAGHGESSRNLHLFEGARAAINRERARGRGHVYPPHGRDAQEHAASHGTGARPSEPRGVSGALGVRFRRGLRGERAHGRRGRGAGNSASGVWGETAYGRFCGAAAGGSGRVVPGDAAEV
ncbi:unnamed protein product [Ascophyllum nodosum]